ncbi:MAG TPA: hypothetical protein V6D29_13630 [Leptolyngbyaceae cyanobacterium]
MALQLLIPADHNQTGFEFPEAYARISDGFVSKFQIQVQVHIFSCMYAAKNAEKGFVPIGQESYYIPLADLDLSEGFAAVYKWLKTNVELFLNAEDVLESNEQVQEQHS